MIESQLSRRRLLATATAAGFAIAGAGAFVSNGSRSSQVLAQNNPGATPIALGGPIPPEYTDAGTNWPSEAGDLKGTRSAQGSGITSSTVAQLGTGWFFPVTTTASYGALVASPSIVGTTLFQQDAMSNVHAIDLTTGTELWQNKHDQVVPSGGPNGTGAGYGLLFYTLGASGDVLGVKQATGEEVWRTNIKGWLEEGITIAPIAYDSVVYVSNIPGDAQKFYSGGQRGFLFALDAGTGTVLWYWDTTTDNIYGSARINSGGGLWHPPSFDDEGVLYAGIGNAAPWTGYPDYPNASSRPGDNDYANSIVKLDPLTGSLDWFLNIKPHDLFDLDNQLTPIIADVDLGDGTISRRVFTSGKHGYVVALDRESGMELWRTPVGKHMNDSLQEIPDGETVTVLPGTLGGVETPMAYAGGVVYAPVLNLPAQYNSVNIAGLDITAGTGELVALSALTGSILWSAQIPTGIFGGAIVTNDVVFTGGLDGLVRGFSTADGTPVFWYQTGAGLNAPFAASGDYLIVPSGGPQIPSTESWANDAGVGIYALKIGGEIQVKPEGTPEPEPSPEETPTVAVVTSGTIDTIDLAFLPNTITIPASTDFQLTVTNKGVLQHDFTIDDPKIATSLLDAGDSETVTINVPAGTYQFHCSVPGHKDAGMVGTLAVQ